MLLALIARSQLRRVITYGIELSTDLILLWRSRLIFSSRGRLFVELLITIVNFVKSRFRLIDSKRGQVLVKLESPRILDISKR